MKRRLFAWLLLLALACPATGISALAEAWRMPAALKTIEYGAFAGDMSITEVEIPSGCASIGDYAFAGCKGLTRVTIPDSVTFIGEHAFDGCDGLTLYAGNNPCAAGYAADHGLRLVSGDADVVASGPCGDSATWRLTASGCLMIEGTGALWAGSQTKVNGRTVIVNTFGDRYREAVRSVLIGEGIESLGDMAFLRCGALETVYLPSTLNDMGESAFRECGKLRAIRLPAGLKTVRPRLFEGCESLSEIAVPEGVTSIDRWAFCNTDLNSIRLPVSLTDIAYDAFDGCPSALTLYTDYYDAAYDFAKERGISCVVGCREKYLIDGASCEGRQLSVSVTTEDACALHYTIIDEESGNALFNGAADAGAGLWNAPVAITLDESLPAHFELEAQLFTADGHRLNDVYHTIRLTSRYAAYRNGTIDDYADHVTIDYGGGNFAALVEGAVDAFASSSWQSEGVYSVALAESPRAGDVLLVKNDKGEAEPILARSVSPDGAGGYSVVEDADATLSQLFDSYRVDVSCIATDRRAKGGDDDGNVAYLGEIVFNEKFGPVTINIDGGMRYHTEMVYDKKFFGEDYYEYYSTVELNTEAEVDIKEAYECKDLDLFTLFDEPIVGIKGLAGISLKLSVPFSFKVDAGVNISGQWLAKIGVRSTPDGQEPIVSNEFKPDIKGEAGFEGTLIGVKVEAYAALVKDLIKASISGEVSLRARADLAEVSEAELVMMVTGTQERMHACSACVDGRVWRHAAINFSITWEISDTCNGDLINLDLLNADVEVFTFYISVVNELSSLFHGLPSMGFGECPNYRYRTVIGTRQADGSGAVGIPLTLRSGGETVDAGKSPHTAFLYPGNYTALAEFPNDTAAQNFKVTTAMQTVYVVEKTYQVSGKVTNEQGDGISGAEVLAEDAQGKAYIATTGADGSYKIELTKGEYTFEFSAQDHEPKTVSQSVSDNMPLNATLSKIKYRVTFDPNGGTCATATTEVEIHQEIGELPTPQWDDYAFVGWNTEADGSGEEVLSTTVPTGNMTAYAIWRQVGVRVTGLVSDYEDDAPIPNVVARFALKGGDTVSTSTDDSGKFRVFLPFGTYDFTFTHEDYRTETMTAVRITEDSSNALGVLMVPKDYAIVTFLEADGAYLGKTVVKKGELAGKPADPVPEDDTLEFVGWFEAGVDTAFDFAHTPVDGDITLYARWKEPTPEGCDLAYVLDLDIGKIAGEMEKLGFRVSSYSATHAGAADCPKVEWSSMVVIVTLHATDAPVFSLRELTSDMTEAALRQKLTADGWSYDGRETYRPEALDEDVYEYMYTRGKYTFSIHVVASSGNMYAISMSKWRF